MFFVQHFLKTYITMKQNPIVVVLQRKLNNYYFTYFTLMSLVNPKILKLNEWI